PIMWVARALGISNSKTTTEGTSCWLDRGTKCPLSGLIPRPVEVRTQFRILPSLFVGRELSCRGAELPFSPRTLSSRQATARAQLAWRRRAAPGERDGEAFFLVAYAPSLSPAFPSALLAASRILCRGIVGIERVARTANGADIIRLSAF